jgi:ubiquinone/menaquinone biosynthesis C-methylase UbiE
MPVESGDTVLDLGTGSGYAVRALTDTKGAQGYGLDRSPGMLRNARQYASGTGIGFLRGDFEALPLHGDAVDHVFSMEAIYYADIPDALEEIVRVLRPGGTFYCAVDFYEENHYSHDWPETVGVEMTLWSARDYREAFRDAGLAVASQDNLPDRDVDIPPEDEFPTEGFETRGAMVERYRELGTLLTVGVARD